ncbi:MAG: acetyl-CoA hydrolase/transferase family protein [Muribaculaceae bacterium]|nr:acetyl-CoA hydrolase/transferase family protein [Muribaculaceae bacterium]MDY3933582.1 acetyl-CoA hydrolase/transferase family protein [Muribaculaceae bacterium]
MSIPFITAPEAADFVKNGDNVGLSGFTASGTPKVVTTAIADKATAEHAKGNPFKINLFTGASTNDYTDGALARADALNFRTPYQSCPDLRKSMNSGRTHYADAHLSELAQKLRYGFFGKINVCIIEAQDVTEDGEIVLGTGVGNVPTFAMMAEKIIIELNSTIHPKIRGLHDVYMPLDPPYRREIPVYKPSDRIGSEVLKVDPKKIVGIVRTDNPGHVAPFSPLDETTMQIGANVCHFLASELKAGRLPKEFLPLQSGVGNVANAVLSGLAADATIPAFTMYTEVVQDSVLKLMEQGKCTFASTCSLSLSDDGLHEFFGNIDFFRDKVLIRPGEISNNPEIVRRLGIISMNTALEADIFGNVNSTHVLGTKMMNGIGGSGDFTRNAYVSIFSCPSITKGGLISNIVPMVSHLDHSEHSVAVLITDQGIADLRGKDPLQRAETIIENCAHPSYRPLLRDYLKLAKGGHTPHTLKSAFAFHQAFIESGNMADAKF